MLLPAVITPTTLQISSNDMAKATALSITPKFIDAACKPSELPVISNGLPPPLCVFPDFCDADAAEDEEVVLEAEVLDLDGDSVEGLETEGEETPELKVMEMGGGEMTDVMDGAESTDVSVRRLPVVASAEETFIVLWPMDSVAGAGAGAAEVCPAVVVTTVTSHRIWIPRPALKTPITELSETTSFSQLAWTALVICTSPWRQLLEHLVPLMKSTAVQPGIASL